MDLLRNIHFDLVRAVLADVSYTGSEIINVHKTKEQREHNKTLFPNPNQNNNGSFVLRHLSPVHESLPAVLIVAGKLSVWLIDSVTN